MMNIGEIQNLEWQAQVINNTLDSIPKGAKPFTFSLSKNFPENWKSDFRNEDKVSLVTVIVGAHIYNTYLHKTTLTIIARKVINGVEEDRGMILEFSAWSRHHIKVIGSAITVAYWWLLLNIESVSEFGVCIPQNLENAHERIHLIQKEMRGEIINHVLPIDTTH